MGAAFVTLLPRSIQEVPRFIPAVSASATGGVLTTQQLEQIIYGLLIIVFLIVEPRGLRPLGPDQELLDEVAFFLLMHATRR